MQHPQAACWLKMTVGVVNNQSASTTWRLVTAMCVTLPLRSPSIYKGAAQARSNSSTMLRMCNVLSVV